MAQTIKNLTMQETRVPESGRSPGEGNSLPAVVFLPRQFYRQRNLAGYSPWDLKESDRIERLTLSLSTFNPKYTKDSPVFSVP